MPVPQPTADVVRTYAVTPADFTTATATGAILVGIRIEVWTTPEPNTGVRVGDLFDAYGMPVGDLLTTEQLLGYRFGAAGQPSSLYVSVADVNNPDYVPGSGPRYEANAAGVPNVVDALVDEVNALTPEGIEVAVAQAVEQAGTELQSFTVADEAEMLALASTETLRRGAFAARADTASTWQLLGDDPALLESWRDLSAGPEVDLSELDSRFTAGREWVGGSTGWGPRVAGDQVDVSRPAPPAATLDPPQHLAGDIILRQVQADAVYLTPTSTPTANQRPVANAGPAQSVARGTTVTLRGTDSDPDGVVASRLWTQVSGPTVTLSGATTRTPTFASPTSDATLVFSYVVTDDRGLTSEPSTTTIVVSATAAAVVTAYGASSDSVGYASDEAKWAALENALRDAASSSSQMMTLRGTFENNGSTIPTAMNGGQNQNKALGATRHLHRFKIRPWLTWANEYDAWSAAGFPDVTNGTTYPKIWSLRQHLELRINPFTTAGHEYDAGLEHEPENDPAADEQGVITGTGTGSGTDESQAAYRKAIALACKVIARYGNERVWACPIFMGQTWTGTGTYPMGGGTKTRSPSHWNFWQYLTPAEKLRVRPGIDKYHWNTASSGGPGNAIRGFSSFFANLGFGAIGIGEIAAAFDTSDDAMALVIAKRIGDPSMNDSMRRAIDQCNDPTRTDLIPVAYSSYFHSGVNYEGGKTGSLTHPYTVRAMAQTIRDLDFNPTGA